MRLRISPWLWFSMLLNRKPHRLQLGWFVELMRPRRPGVARPAVGNTRDNHTAGDCFMRGFIVPDRLADSLCVSVHGISCRILAEQSGENTPCIAQFAPRVDAANLCSQPSEVLHKRNRFRTTDSPPVGQNILFTDRIGYRLARSVVHLDVCRNLVSRNFQVLRACLQSF